MPFVISKSVEEINYLIYLVQKYQSAWAFKHLFLYYERLFYIVTERYLDSYLFTSGNRRFYHLWIYEIFYESLLTFRLPTQTFFINFCLRRWKWKLQDLLRSKQALAKKLPSFDLDKLAFSLPAVSLAPDRAPNQPHHLLIPKKIKLSFLEQQIFRFRFSGYQNLEIASDLAYSARQIANGWERTKKKLKKYYNI